MLHLPGIIDPDAMGEFELCHCLAVDATLGCGVSRARNLTLVEDTEFHVSCFSGGAGPSLR